MWIWVSTPMPLDGLYILYNIVPKAGFTNQLQYSAEPGAKGSGKKIRHPGTWEMEKYIYIYMTVKMPKHDVTLSLFLFQ